MSDLVIGVIIGAIGASLVMAIVAVVRSRAAAQRYAMHLAERDDTIFELRQEASGDKETNRRLRHELAVSTPTHLLETASVAEMERDAALSERDQALDQLDLVHRDLGAARTRLASQGTKLRAYREALQEIRESLEAQDRGRSVSQAAMFDTGDLPTDEPPEVTDRPRLAEAGSGGSVHPADSLPSVAPASPGVVDPAPEPVDLGAVD